MKRLLLLGMLLASTLAAAQFTTVTATVVDPNGLPYAGGTVSATLVASASPTLNGFAYSPPTQPTGLNTAGKFTIRLADNTVLLPAASTWNFKVCSAIGTILPAGGTGPVCFTVTGVTISGASQDISATLNAAAVALSLITGGGGGTTINPTNGVIPVRANATTFNDSPFSVASGNVSDSGNLTINGTPAAVTFNSVTLTSQVNSFATLTDTAANSDAGFNAVTIINPAGASSANFYSYASSLQTPAANTQNFSFSSSGYYCQAQNNGSGNFTYAGTAGGWACFLGSVLHNGSGTIAKQSAFNATSNSIGGGIITANIGFVGVTGFGSAATGSITNDYTFRATNPGLSGTASMTHHYGFECDAGQTGGTGNTDGWCFFSNPADKSQLGFTTASSYGLITGSATPASFTGLISNAGNNLDLFSGGNERFFISGTKAEFNNIPLCDWNTGNQCFDINTLNKFQTSGTGIANGEVELGFNVNVVPVTVSANVTTDQNLMAVTIPANNLNLAGRTFRVFVAGVYSTPAASTATITIEVKLCSVSGCAAGNVADLIDVTSSANPGTVTNNAFNLTAYFTTQTAGAAGRWEAHGVYGIDLGALNTSPDSFFNDTNTAVIAGTPADIDTTAQNFLQVAIAFSAASASNSATERQLVVEMVN
jgi:hypothetical protein